MCELKIQDKAQNAMMPQGQILNMKQILKNSNMKSLTINFLIISMMISSMISCSSSVENGEQAGGKEVKAAEQVRVMKMDYTEIARKLNYTAHLQAYREVYLASASPGRIDKIHVEIGNKVKAGQLLVEMDKTQLQQAEVQFRNIETDYRRLDTLRKVGSISQQQFDQIQAQYLLTKSNVEFLQENTRLLAPFSGIVADKYYENGEMFSGAPNTTAGKAAILKLVHTSTLNAKVNVAERYYSMVSEGSDVEITLDVFPGEVFTGSVLRVYPTIDPTSRTFTIELSVPNQHERLRPGMFARASLEVDQVQAFVAPALAILKLQGSNERYVFIEENGIAHRVVVELGDRFDEMVEIISNEIEPGSNLIIAGHARLLDGVAVSIKQ